MRAKKRLRIERRIARKLSQTFAPAKVYPRVTGAPLDLPPGTYTCKLASVDFAKVELSVIANYIFTGTDG